MKGLFAIWGIFLSMGAICQVKSSSQVSPWYLGVRLPATIINGDTVGIVDMSEQLVCGHRVFANCTEAANYYILEQNIKTVYPYALMAQANYEQCEQALSTLTDKSEKKKYLKQMEKQLMGQYEQELKGLTVEQGRLLIKLIDRQTGSTSYDLVKQMKGSLSAFMWQTVATLFGNSMKDTYDPAGEDKDIENIIHLIEQGII
ncbi:MAG: DUF4294 domain-containing protein [Bacteroidia bacterium]